MKKSIAIVAFIFLLLGASVFFFRGKIKTSFQNFFSVASESKSFAIGEIVESLAVAVFAPPPIRAPAGGEIAALSSTQIREATNRARTSNGLGPLALEAELDEAASKKIEDMIEKNYFAHVSPAGTGVDGWVGGAGYRYILLGENLAMGNFKDEEDLVSAWMNSPGHRANILNPKFREIGIAARIGVIEGTPALIAVQIFGLPTSACPEPDETIKRTIEALGNELAAQKANIDVLREKIENAKKENNRKAYSDRIQEYNAALQRYNKAIESAKSLVQFYNTGVRAFNACALKL